MFEEHTAEACTVLMLKQSTLVCPTFLNQSLSVMDTNLIMYTENNTTQKKGFGKILILIL